MSGDSHQYERLEVDGLAYFVNGAGGAGLSGFGTPRGDSRVRYGADHGAMLVTADENTMTLRFYSVANGGSLIDTLILMKPVLSARAASNGRVRVSWSTNVTEFVLERGAPPGTSWTIVTTTPVVEGNEHAVYVDVGGNSFFYRLRKP